MATRDTDTLDAEIANAVGLFWKTRLRQAGAQMARGSSDQGTRGAVTGGAQMDGFVTLIAGLVQAAGVPDASIFREKKLELPGYFRPTKKWDIVIVADGTLLAVIEAKSQVGPSFGNNFNNRTEEAIGSAVDFWTAYREGAFAASPRPWLGYIFLLEDCDKSRQPIAVAEPHFGVFPEFKNASYMKRYELLCRKLVRERHYESAAYLTSPLCTRGTAQFAFPAADLTIAAFAASLRGRMTAFAETRKDSPGG